MEKKIVFVDMDGVLGSFFGALGRVVTPDEEPMEIYDKGFYRNMPVMEGAVWAIEALLENDNLDVWVASKPTYKSEYCVQEKLDWISEHFPELKKKVFLVPNKNLLKGDYLIDDHPNKWNSFEGEVIYFNPLEPVKSWIRAIAAIGGAK